MIYEPRGWGCDLPDVFGVRLYSRFRCEECGRMWVKTCDAEGSPFWRRSFGTVFKRFSIHGKWWNNERLA